MKERDAMLKMGCWSGGRWVNRWINGPAVGPVDTQRLLEAAFLSTPVSTRSLRYASTISISSSSSPSASMSMSPSTSS
jgi:hypothetical protein